MFHVLQDYSSCLSALFSFLLSNSIAKISLVRRQHDYFEQAARRSMRTGSNPFSAIFFSFCPFLF